MNSTVQVYEKHHKNVKRENFTIMEKERGELFSEIIGQNKDVLDIGCRSGVLTKYFTENNNIVGVDIDGGALKKIKKELGVETLSIDLNDDWNGLGGMKFDVIVAAEVLEHLYFPNDVMKRACKYLNEGGIFVGSVPNAFSFKNRLRYLFGTKKNTPLEDPTHINQFSYHELEKILLKNFMDVEIIGLGRFKRMARLFPNMFAFDLVFKAKI